MNESKYTDKLKKREKVVESTKSVKNPALKIQNTKRQD